MIPALDDSDNENDQEEPLLLSEYQNLCVVTQRDATWLLFPCKHTNCCTYCTNTIMEPVKSCPTCRCEITEKIQIYLN